MVIDRGILIPRAEFVHGGVYHCQLEEHGFRWTAVTIHLNVIGPAPSSVPAPGSAQSWFLDVMSLIHPSDLKKRCRELNHRRHGNRERERHRGRKRGDRHREGGRSGGGGGGGEGRGRKNRSKAPTSAQRLPRST